MAKKRYSREYMQAIAEKRGGSFLSPEYSGCAVKHKWQCSKGHVWETTPASITGHNTWCPICGYVRKNKLEGVGVERLQGYAQSRGGTLVDAVYRGLRFKYTWQCAKGHEWKANGGIVVSKNTWCPFCVKRGKNRNVKTWHNRTLSKLQRFADSLREYDRITDKKETFTVNLCLGAINGIKNLVTQLPDPTTEKKEG